MPRCPQCKKDTRNLAIQRGTYPRSQVIVLLVCVDGHQTFLRQNFKRAQWNGFDARRLNARDQTGWHAVGTIRGVLSVTFDAPNPVGKAIPALLPRSSMDLLTCPRCHHSHLLAVLHDGCCPDCGGQIQ